ncbi:hypothetical protein [Sulfuricurvum sp.]|uniref:hypothetical protein n=1 Tax=Sulfuricurvum sp. TaxID=2025608 RepID=UPI002D485CAB|nr:hypothetical protein [Sulfuricurvum sp.]HZF69924.1 hypothetical protein [Sulfuricurvum sp.]
MSKIKTTFSIGLLIALLPSHLSAFGVILQYQGEVDNREAYFADVRVIKNRTPPNQIMGPTEIREIDVTAVYENPNKPEFVHTKLQFECPNSYSMNMETHQITENKQKVKSVDSVKFRIGENSYKLRRSDLKAEPIPVSDWKTSDAPMLLKAGTIACNDIEFDKALHAAIKSKDFDFDGFGKRISKLGLPSDLPLIGQTLSPEFLDFAWDQLWWDKVSAGKRPDPSGKWAKVPTKEEKEAAIKKLQAQYDAVQPQIEAAKKSLLSEITKAQTQRKADIETAKNGSKHPDGSKMNKYEAKLANVFHGQTEQQVVEYMGNPQFNQAGDTRFLRYTQTWEKQGVTVYGSQGVIGGDAGGYAECFAEFSLKQDAQGVWRVDDILVRSDYEGIGSREVRLLCNDIVRGK